MPAKRNKAKSESVIVPNDLVVNLPTELNVEIPLRRSRQFRRPTLSDDYAIFMRMILLG